ncbi:MAG: hypothetical protein VYA30_10555 [Myxococcota bacterium]|nr:hypothetical protein [Myxococcota bacterium]
MMITQLPPHLSALRVTWSLLCAFLVISASGCHRPDNSLRPPPAVDLEDGGSLERHEWSLILDLRIPFSDNPATGPYTILVMETETDQVVLQIDVPFIDTWPHTIRSDKQLRGSHQLVAFLDRNADGQFDNCPFPSTMNATESADQFDNIQSTKTVTFPLNNSVELNFERRICGPGVMATKLVGSIEGLDFPTDGPLRLTAVNRQDDSVIRVQVVPYTDQSTNSVRFEIPEFLPGVYDVTLFTDEDDDFNPTSCDALFGGADRHVASPVSVTILDGVSNEVDAPFQFSPSVCPERLTGVSGSIGFGSTIPIGDLNQSSLSGLVEGKLWINLYPLDDNSESIDVPIETDLLARSGPLKYTVTGVPTGLWRLTAYIDRDEDRFFSPCNTVGGGLDAISGSVDSIRIQPEEISRTGDVVLDVIECDESSLSAVRGELTIVGESGPIGSGRRVNLHVTKSDQVGDSQTITIFENHNDHIGATSQFLKQLNPGQYTGQFFVDTTRDALFNTCTPDTYGDRYVSQDIAFDISENTITELGSFVLTPAADCHDASQEVQIVVDASNVSTVIPQDMYLLVSESGGWTEIFSLRDQNLGASFSVGTFPPGDYRLTVFQDANSNGSFDDCDLDGLDTVYGTTVLEIDADLSPPETRINLRINCTQ